MTDAAKPPKEPFAYQAALVGVWAPIIAIILSIAVQSGMKDEPRSPTVTIMMAVVGSLFILVGFVCSIIALLAVPRRGKANLLTRGLVGLAINGFFLAASAYLIFFFRPLDSLYPKYAGNWRLESASPGFEEVLDLSQNKQFHLTITGTEVADLSGDWGLEFDPNRKLILVLKVTHFVTGAPGLEGKTIGMEVKRFEGDILRFVKADGEQVFRRTIPNP